MTIAGFTSLSFLEAHDPWPSECYVVLTTEQLTTHFRHDYPQAGNYSHDRQVCTCDYLLENNKSVRIDKAVTK